MNKKVSGCLGMAMRARKLSLGDGVIESIRNKKAKLVLISDEASDNTKKKLTDKCNYYQIDYLFIEDDLLNESIGTNNRKAVAIMEEGFANMIKTCLKG